jgi:alkanesulfonate monooxygenase SsuD/methylene tetrahydromethanopterin reductase-like flavin-dependent oxidoreductase (luciferase family)
MKIGIGLPNVALDINGRLLVDWAKEAEARGFSSLATIDRVAFPSYESIQALTAAAGATERIGLVTNILLEPTRNPVLLAKEAAGLDQISEGRFILGLGPGLRPDDFTATGLKYSNRGKRMDRDLDLMHRAWAGELVEGAENPVTPTPTNGKVPLIFGGTSDAAIERTIKWGIGWTAGGAPAPMVEPFIERVRQAWSDAGREGDPHIMGLGYFGLGEDPDGIAERNIRTYYGQYADFILPAMPRTADALQAAQKSFEELGVDEFFWDPTIPNVEQVDRLADLVL